MSTLFEHSPKRLVIAITGASGTVYGIRLLRALKDTEFETHLIFSKAAAVTLRHESDLTSAEVQALADVVHAPSDLAAPLSSGSFRTLGMIVAPCSVRTLSDIAYGHSDSLIARAADVTLKQRRPLVLLVRETPLHLGHLRAMTQAAEIGAVIMPPVPAFYGRPRSIEDLVDHTAGRALDLFGIDLGLVKRWRET